MDLLWMQDPGTGGRDGKKDAEMIRKAVDAGILPELEETMEKIEANPWNVYMERDRERMDRLAPYIRHIRQGAVVVEWMGTYMVAVTVQQKRDMLCRLEKEQARRARADAGLCRALEAARAAAGR